MSSNKTIKQLHETVGWLRSDLEARDRTVRKQKQIIADLETENKQLREQRDLWEYRNNRSTEIIMANVKEIKRLTDVLEGNADPQCKRRNDNALAKAFEL